MTLNDSTMAFFVRKKFISSTSNQARDKENNEISDLHKTNERERNTRGWMQT